MRQQDIQTANKIYRRKNESKGNNEIPHELQ